MNQNNREKLPAICFDFDGVIVEHNDNWENNPIPFKELQLLPGATEVINKLYEKYRIIINSARFNFYILGDESYRQITGVQNFLHDNGIKFDDISPYKPIAEYYIDDKALLFVSWEEIKRIVV